MEGLRRCCATSAAPIPPPDGLADFPVNDGNVFDRTTTAWRFRASYTALAHWPAVTPSLLRNSPSLAGRISHPSACLPPAGAAGLTISKSERFNCSIDEPDPGITARMKRPMSLGVERRDPAAAKIPRSAGGIGFN